jgi:hypothetical protein
MKDCSDDGAFRRFLDDVKARTDLVALIGRDLDLEPSGSVLKARSPKHRDTDPSFVVWPARPGPGSPATHRTLDRRAGARAGGREPATQSLRGARPCLLSR